MISNETPLIFTHLPKTGGMSLFASVVEKYGMQVGDLYNISALNDDRSEAAELLQNTEISVYAGHFPFGLHEFLSRPSYYLAFVRKPLDRIISLYHYSVGFRAQMRKTRKETSRTLDDQIAAGEHPDFYADFAPWINGEETLMVFLNCASPELDNGMVRRFSGYGLKASPCPPDSLQQAKENIEKYYSMIGVQERYGESVGLMRVLFKHNFKEYSVNKGTHKNDKTKKLPSTIKKRILGMNKLDSQLYDWVIERFDQNLVNPPAAILVDGGGRTDFDQLNLWHAIGSSPIRKKAMELSPATRKG